MRRRTRGGSRAAGGPSSGLREVVEWGWVDGRDVGVSAGGGVVEESGGGRGTGRTDRVRTGGKSEERDGGGRPRSEPLPAQTRYRGGSP